MSVIKYKNTALSSVFTQKRTVFLCAAVALYSLETSSIACAIASETLPGLRESPML